MAGQWRHHLRTALAVAAAAGLAARCGPSNAPKQGGTAVIASAAGPRSANPLVASDVYSQEMNRSLLFLPLLRFGADLSLEPDLAESWNMEGDTAAVFHLRRDVRWQDGRRVNADDAVFTIRRALDPATGYPNAGQIHHWHGVQRVDSFTVRLSFDPVREPLAALPLLPVLPRHVLDTVPPAAMAHAASNTRPVGDGPFRVVERRPDRWVFAANDSFPQALGGRPRLDRLIWRTIPESTSQIATLEAGEVDLVMGVQPDDYARYADTLGLRGIERPTFRYSFIAWNGRRPPLDEVPVRRALSLAIDRPQILAALRHGHGALAAGPVPPTHWAADTLAPLPYDTAQADRILDQAGFRRRDRDGIRHAFDGSPVRFTLLLPAGSDFNRDLAQVVQADLRNVGVDLELRPLEFSTLVQTITGPERDFDAVLLALDADVRLDLRSLFHSAALAGPFQLAGYSNSVLDSLLDAIDTTTDGAAARPLWARAQAILARDQPWTFLYFFSDLMLARDRLHGVQADLRGVLFSAPDWWVAARPSAAQVAGGR
ncbi:MAG TPA: ABC transporter substrate-binding protein [Longimicrobiales bacterium]|nr:ABC transporter substrate-binding protein [Longimicrobiales bacterium]